VYLLFLLPLFPPVLSFSLKGPNPPHALPRREAPPSPTIFHHGARRLLRVLPRPEEGPSVTYLVYYFPAPKIPSLAPCAQRPPQFLAAAVRFGDTPCQGTEQPLVPPRLVVLFAFSGCPRGLQVSPLFQEQVPFGAEDPSFVCSKSHLPASLVPHCGMRTFFINPGRHSSAQWIFTTATALPSVFRFGLEFAPVGPLSSLLATLGEKFLKKVPVFPVLAYVLFHRPV